MANISFGREVTSNYSKATSREWLLTNGLGGYASSTIIGENCRKYHGLLIAAMDPPWNRKLLLSKLEEEILLDGRKLPLSTNKYPQTVYPDGYRNLYRFSLDPFPKFIYLLRDIRLEKMVFMPHLTNSLIVEYRVLNNTKSRRKPKMRIYPLVNSRGIHEITKMEDLEWKFVQENSENQVKVVATYPQAPDLILGSDLLSWRESGYSEEKRWFRNMEYREERRRGYEYHEDHYNPGFFEIKLKPGFGTYHLLITGGPGIGKRFEQLHSERKFEEARQRAEQRRYDLVQEFSYFDCSENELKKHLVWAANSFLVHGKEDAIIAGYPWFSIWGRDTLIALPGIALVLGDYGTARRILSSILTRCKWGLLPEVMGDSWETYKGVDVSLLFFQALHKYLMYTDDLPFLDRIWKQLNGVLESYAKGTKYVKMDEDGLIQNDEGCTWMDVWIEGEPATPRRGKTVEINALWYNSLKIMEILSEKIDKDWSIDVSPKEIRSNFNRKFWNSERECLYDFIREDHKNPEVRPNQILAVSLPFQLIRGKKASKAVLMVREKLLTPYGLRSLEEEAYDYRGSYEGDQSKRDEAYHQGTVWSWLIGPFVTAFVKVNGQRGAEDAGRFLEPLMNDHLYDAGLGTISEIFDGDEPHTPRGCISQAWNVGEILRSYVEDVRGIRPPFEKRYREI